MTENSKYNLLIIVAYLKKICFLFYVFHKHSVDTQIMFFFFFFYYNGSDCQGKQCTKSRPDAANVLEVYQYDAVF